MEQPSVWDSLTTILETLKAKFVEFSPNFLIALGVFLTGYFLAHLLRFLVSRLVTRLHRFLPTNQAREAFRSMALGKPVSDLMGTIVFWAVVFVFLTLSTEIMGMQVVTTWLSGLTTYMPRVLAAVLIGVVGVVSGSVLRDTVVRAAASAGLEYSPLLGKIVQIAVVTVTAVVAVGQVGVDVQFLTIVSVLFLGAVLGALALAFGLGSKGVVSNILSSHYVQKQYSVGNDVRIGEVEGKITEITSTAVFVETKAGKVMVPAKEFTEFSSIKLKKSQ